MRRRITLLFLTLLLVLSCSGTAFAQNIGSRKTGSINLTLVEPKEKLPIAGAEFELHYVASAVLNEDLSLNFAYAGSFKGCDISFYDEKLAEKYDAYLPANAVAAEKLVTDAAGKSSSRELPFGMYLVKQVGTVDGLRQCAPFVVTIPVISGTDIVYDVDAMPKTELIWLTDIHIKKVWNTDKITTIPQSVTVQLLHGEDVVETVKLNKANNWQVTCKDLPTSDAYSIKEINVPKGFTPTYTRTDYTFTVTNTPSLAQTGQLLWPIPLLAALGLFFLMAGFLILRKPEETDA